MQPVHFGASQTVYGWFRELARRFLFQTIHDVELMLDRERRGREQSPSAAVINSRRSRLRRRKSAGSTYAYPMVPLSIAGPAIRTMHRASNPCICL